VTQNKFFLPEVIPVGNFATAVRKVIQETGGREVGFLTS
jgi:hypothetical protein